VKLLLDRTAANDGAQWLGRVNLRISEQNSVAARLPGGLKGGRARAEKLSARRRREIARQAAAARWNSE
jgi:hypothetical protein